MKKSTKIIGAVILSIGVVGGAAAFGKHKLGDHESHANYMMGYITEELQLDSTQEQALKSLKDEVLTIKGELHNDEDPIRQQMKTLLDGETFDQVRALELINTRTAVINEKAPGVINALANFLDGLNAEQKAEIQEFVEKRSGRGRGHHRH